MTCDAPGCGERFVASDTQKLPRWPNRWLHLTFENQSTRVENIHACSPGHLDAATEATFRRFMEAGPVL